VASFPVTANGLRHLWYFLGDYQGLKNDGTHFEPFFVKTNSDLSNRTDVFSSTITQ
jgi:hypothetical protein